MTITSPQKKQFCETQYEIEMNKLAPRIKKIQKRFKGFKNYGSVSHTAQKSINKIQKSRTLRESKKGKKDRPPLPSFSTVITYLSCFRVAENFLRENKLGTLNLMTPEIAQHYLLVKSHEYVFSTLKKHRQALQWLLKSDGRLPLEAVLPTYPCKPQSKNLPRAYSYGEVVEICKYMTERNSISVWIAFYAGLRAHEFLDIRRCEERKADSRPSNGCKFWGREKDGVMYTVKGKTALVRDVVIPKWLAEKIEGRRKSHFRRKMDRKIPYNPRYDLGAGANLSSAFSRASKKALEFSRGFHGLRHSYAQRRFATILELTDDVDLTFETVSQEIGHFRGSVTKTYLRGLDLAGV